MMSEKRTAVIGCGRMGRRHLEVLRELGMLIVGVCDVNAEVVVEVGEEYGLPQDALFSDPELLLQTVSAEVVVIATTCPSHASLTCMAAAEGATHILCEKPMATSLAECNRMIQACAQHGTRLAINHQMRFMPHYMESKRVVDSDEFGGLTSVTVVAGNFGLAMNGTHYFEMLRYMSDEAPSEVTAWFADENVSNPRGKEFLDRAGSIRVSTTGGTRFYMDAGVDQGHGLSVLYAGPSGQLAVDELTGVLRMSVREAEHRDLASTRYAMPAVIRQWEVAAADATAPTRSVVEALLADENYPSGEDGRHAVATLVAAYVSNENGHLPVRVDVDALPADRVFPWA